MATVTEVETIAMSLPVAYVAPGQPLATVYARLDGWAQLPELLRTLDRRGTKPRLAYVYQMPEIEELLGMLVLQTPATGFEEAVLSKALESLPGLHTISIQRAEAGLAMAERQTPDLVGTPAVIFGRPIISSLTQGIIRAHGPEGERLLHQLGRDAGTLAASALPPLLKKLDLTIGADLLTRRIRDLQVMGWAAVQRATFSDALRGEVILADTFEAEAWMGQGGSPKCHFLSGFMAGVFSVAWQRPFECRETACQAAGLATCRFTLQPSDS